MSYSVFAGPQIVGLKPVYLNIYYPGHNSEPGTVHPERYDPDVHTSQSTIVGYADGRYGWSEMAFSYGLQAGTSLQITWGNAGSGIKLLEVGANLDVYPSGLTVMANTKNPKVYGILFASLLWGVDSE
jgi:hypothetical protein